MKRLIPILILALVALVPAAVQAGDYHSGTNLVCSDCHVAHYSQTHVYNPGDFPPVPLGTAGPYKHLLRNEDNELCLTCHDSKTWAPDVFGVNGGTAMNRLAGALNAAAGSPRANDTGYEDIDGHTLWSTATAPGGTWSDATGLKCVSCHTQHGSTTQYRNLRTSTSSTNTFYNKPLTYAVTTNDPTKDVFERAARAYSEADVDYNEPNTSASAYGAWCASCHPNFHGAGGAANMGGASGGDAGLAFPWLRHPTADVNVGQNASYISSLTQYNSHTNAVKVMSPSNNGWTLPVTAGVTPSCFSCHKSHGNKNGFSLIYMKGTGTVTEEGDGGVYKDLCRQCHIQGA